MVTASDEEPGLRLDCLGISHRTATSELRERAGFSHALLHEALTRARRDPRIERLVIISTCHRAELYAEAPAGTADVPETLLGWWSEISRIPADDLRSCTYALSGMDAARHLFRVAAGLDSVVVGEAQIVAQVASSLRRSVAVHAASPLLKLAFKNSVRAGERARGQVWGRLQAASLGSAAVDAAATITHDLHGLNVVVVGAGEIAELALRSLQRLRPHKVTVANRTVEAAVELASRHGVEASALDAIPLLLHDADVVIAATRAMQPLIDSDTVAAAVAHRRDGRRLALIDVSLPRNIDVAVRDISGVQLVGIDELGQYVNAAHTERKAIAPMVERIVDEELRKFETRARGRRRVMPAVAPHHATAGMTPIMAV